MAIKGPKTIDGAPVGETAKESFLVFPRGMPAPAGRGRKLDDAVAPRAIEAQLVFGQISPLRGRTGADWLSGKLKKAMATTLRHGNRSTDSGVDQPSVRFRNAFDST
ncbi:MAG: hypothetical protein Q8O80_17295 [Devosia sp.]|nr:hypothetical protein [Devosia sp.]